jgi:hypothetical protein
LGDIEKRITELEKLTETPNPTRSDTLKTLYAILDEIASLKSSCAPHLRGGVPIEPENIPRQILGPGYTHGELLSLAVERAAQKGTYPPEESPRWEAVMIGMSRVDLDEVVEWERGEA